MKFRTIIIIGVIVVAIAIVFNSFRGGDADSYVSQVLKEREEKDRFMKTADDSPLKDKSNFKGLKYYPPDPRFRIVADLVPVDNPKMVILKTSDGREQRYLEYAHADFSLDGIRNRLLILEIIDMGPSRGKLFLAFGDETSAVETYGAGRYLDLVKTPGAATITLDFNKAYNPYCAYDATFSCPLPPPENLLRIPIKAGEKNYDH